MPNTTWFDTFIVLAVIFIALLGGAISFSAGMAISKNLVIQACETSHIITLDNIQYICLPQRSS